MDRETVEPALAISLENMEQPISGKSVEQWWKRSLGHAKGCSEENGNDLANVGRDQVTDELLGVVVDRASFLDGDFNGGKVAVSKNHIGCQLRYVGSRTHSNTDISLLQSRGIVDTVTGHGNNLVEGLKEIDQSGLVARLNTGEQRCTLSCLELLARRQLIKLATSIALSGKIFMLTKDANLSADTLSSVAVVSGDNDNTNTSILTLLNSAGHLLAGRVKHANQTKEGHVLFKLGILFGRSSGVKKRVLGHVVNACEGNNSKTVVAISYNLAQETVCNVLSKRNLLAVGAEEGLCAAINNGLGGTLDQELLIIGVSNQDRHALTITREFVRSEAGELLLVSSAGIMNTVFGAGFGGSAGSNLLDQNSKGALGGFANAGEGSRLRIVGKLGVVTDGGNLGHLTNSSRSVVKVLDNDTARLDGSSGGKGSPLDIKLVEIATILVEMHNLAHAHLVGGQGTGLVRANHTAASQGFDRRKASDDGILSSHLPRSKSQAGGDNNGKTLGDSGNTKRDSNLEVVDSALGPAAMAGIVEVGDVDKPDQNANDSNDLGQAVTEIVKLLLQGGGLRDLSSDALMDISNSSAGASKNDDSSGATSNNSCSREQHVGLILQDCLIIVDNLRSALSDTLTLSGKNCLVDREAVAFDRDDSAVGRNTIANGDSNDVARNQLLGLDS
ncbi:hypothetical protein HG530_012785 [Fusarium avenaceum]|nr:hypothetical protein HG530_012785 [Fusarium avenaceum]